MTKIILIFFIKSILWFPIIVIVGLIAKLGIFNKFYGFILKQAVGDLNRTIKNTPLEKAIDELVKKFSDENEH
jgi:hypothetical protein